MPSHFWFHSNQQTIYSCFCSRKPGKFFKVSEDFIYIYVIISNIFLENRNFTNHKGEFIPWSSILPIPTKPTLLWRLWGLEGTLADRKSLANICGYNIGRSSYHFQQKYILQSYRFTILLNNNSPIEKTHEHATSQKNTSILFKFRFKIRETVLLTVNFRNFPTTCFFVLSTPPLCNASACSRDPDPKNRFPSLNVECCFRSLV